VIHAFGGKRLVVASANHYIAPGAQIIGDVRLGEGASVWFNAVLRGDCAPIDIGAGSNIQDATVIHSDPGQGTIVGRNVTVGHRVLLHGCRIDDECLIGNGAIILDGVQVGRHCLVAAGAMLTPGKVFPAGSVIMGSPGRVVREVGARELEMIARGARAYQERVPQYLAEPTLNGSAS
jgi:carbonic anhydrase/acetyltransferase-like protein (isoleucine patch superfamily)